MLQNLLADKNFVALVSGLVMWLGGKLWSWLDQKSGDRLTTFADRLQPLFGLVLATQPGLSLAGLHDLLVTNAQRLATSIGLPKSKAIDDAISAEVTKFLDAYVQAHPTPEALVPQLPALVAKLTPQPASQKQGGFVHWEVTAVLAAMAFAALAMISLAACTPKGKADVKQALGSFIDCSGADIWQVVQGEELPLFNLVVAQLSGGKPGWQGELEGLGAKAGEVAYACAVRAYVASFPVNATARTEPPPELARSVSLTAAKGWKYK